MTFHVSPIITARALLLVVAGCIVAAWFFIPDNNELVDRLGRDGQVDRLKELAEEAKVAAAKPLTDTEFVKAWLSAPDEETIGDVKIRIAITEQPIEVGKLILASSHWMDRDLRNEFLELLVRQALGTQKPADAGYLLTQLNRIEPRWQTTERAIQAWRWGQKSVEANDTLNFALANKVLPEDKSFDLSAFREALALEANQPDDAFDIVLARYRAAPADQRSALLRRLLELANAGERGPQAETLVQEFLATIPYHRATVPAALQLVKDHSAFPSNKDEDEYIEYATSLAQWLEWGSKGDQAIDTWFRLALLGREDAWVRCSEIYEDVLRTDDFTAVLAWRHSKGKDRDKTTLLADLTLEAGRTKEAIKLYEKALEIEADDAPLLRALGRIHAQDCDWEKSQHAFERLTSLKPDDLEASLGYADALIHLGKTEQAADQYVRLSAAHIADHHVQETCAVLCNSLGRMTEAMLAMQRLVACPEHQSSPEDFLELAHLYRANGDAPGQIAALREGLRTFPDGIRMRLTLGETLAGLEEHDESIAVLAHPSLRQNIKAIHDILGEALYAQDPLPALRFIGATLPPSLHKDPATRLDFALLHERIGKTTTAQDMVDTLIKDRTLRDGTAWRDLAVQALQTGHINMAEEFVTHYLSTRNDEHDAKAWEILGDIYSVQDREDEALSAYKKAVDTIQPPPAQPQPTPGPQVKVSQN